MRSRFLRPLGFGATASVLLGCGLNPSVSSHTDEPRDCPRIETVAPDVYPRIKFATLILDGVVVLQNQRQIFHGPHVGEVADPRPNPLADLDSGQIKSIEVVLPPEAEELGVCPGVSAIIVSTVGP